MELDTEQFYDKFSTEIPFALAFVATNNQKQIAQRLVNEGVFKDVSQANTPTIYALMNVLHETGDYEILEFLMKDLPLDGKSKDWSRQFIGEMQALAIIDGQLDQSNFSHEANPQLNYFQLIQNRLKPAPATHA